MSGRCGRMAVAAVVCAAGLAACGVPGDDRPRQISTDGVPFGLLDPTTTTTPELPAEATTDIDVYMLQQDSLVPVGRRVAACTPRDVVNALLRGPTDSETNQYTSAIPEGTRLLDLEGPNEAGTVIVDLSKEFLAVEASQQRNSVAQVVLSLTLLPEVRDVRFRFGGERTDVPNGAGELTSEPLSRSSFRQMQTAPVVGAVRCRASGG